MDFGALPPEINSARIYAGPGSGPMLAAAAAWDGLAAQLDSAAAGYTSLISGLTSGPWLGPSSTAMAAAAAPYAAWMSATAGQAELAAIQAKAVAGAYAEAFVMTVPPPVIAANRAQLMSLVATNFFGQNTPAIAATEAQYGEMWAQDAAAMYGYAANSAATTAKLAPFTAAPQTTNPAGLAAQGGAGAQVAGTGVQSTLSQLVSAVPATLQSLASPSSSSPTSGLSGILSGLLGGPSPTASTIGGLGGVLSTSSDFSLGGLMQGVASEYAMIPGWFAMFMGSNALAPLMGTPIGNALTAAVAPLADTGGWAEDAAGAAAGAEAVEGALGSGFGEDFVGLADLGQAASVGALSVPPTWAWAAADPAEMLGAAPWASALLDAAPWTSALAGVNLGTAGGLPLAAGLPLVMGALPRAAAGAGGTAAKYGWPVTFLARSPAAGYPPVPASQPTPAHPVLAVPAGLPPPPPGYTPAIVYLPTNGHKPATV